jgi:hypothetical protein
MRLLQGDERIEEVIVLAPGENLFRDTSANRGSSLHEARSICSELLRKQLIVPCSAGGRGAGRS